MKNPIGQWLNRSKTAGYAGHSVEKFIGALGSKLPSAAKNKYMDEILIFKDLIDECYNIHSGPNKEELLMAGALRGSTGILFGAQYIDKEDTAKRYPVVLAKLFISTISQLKDDEDEGWVVTDFVRQYIEIAEQALLIVETLDY